MPWWQRHGARSRQSLVVILTLSQRTGFCALALNMPPLPPTAIPSTAPPPPTASSEPFSLRERGESLELRWLGLRGSKIHQLDTWRGRVVHLDIPSNAEEHTNDDCCEARVMASGHGIRMQMVFFRLCISSCSARGARDGLYVNSRPLSQAVQHWPCSYVLSRLNKGTPPKRCIHIVQHKHRCIILRGCVHPVDR